MHSHLLTNSIFAPVALTSADAELRTLKLKDARLTRRVKKIFDQLDAQPGASLPKATVDGSGARGAYRAFDNVKVKAAAIQSAHCAATIERARSAPRLLLAPQDTTTLNLSTHPETEGLGPIGNHPKTVGYFLHSTLLVREDGHALGVLDTQVYARDAKAFPTQPKGKRNRQPAEEKESHRWLESITATVRAAAALPETVIVNLADREGDSYAGFRHHQQLRRGLVSLGPEAAAGESERVRVMAAAARVELLIRCQHNRTLGEEAEEKRLFAHLEGQPVAGQMNVPVPRQPGQAKRLATLTVRFACVTLPPPADQVKYQGHTEPILLWIVLAEEDQPPPGVAPICWRLLSTQPVETAETACEMVRRYSRRWTIEEFHRTLKSGCKAEARQLETLDRLKRVLALDIIVAIRVLMLRDASRDPVEGQRPATAWLTDDQWRALWCKHHRRATLPAQPPTIAEAVRWIAQLGGFLARKGDGHPGAMTIWHGLQRLHDLAWAFQLGAASRKDVGNA
jgi:hypothetical protein